MIVSFTNVDTECQNNLLLSKKTKQQLFFSSRQMNSLRDRRKRNIEEIAQLSPHFNFTSLNERSRNRTTPMCIQEKNSLLKLTFPRFAYR